MMSDYGVSASEYVALRQLAAAIGADSSLTQGAGGNVSIKSASRMWIKASGTWLADAMNAEIIVPVALSPRSGGGYVAGEAIEGTLRPSIETSMHAALPQTVVIHVHSVDAIALAVRTDAEARMAERLDGLRWAFVPYHRPGQPLTDAVVLALGRSPADVLVLANHGLVVAAADVAQARALLDEVVARLKMPARATPAGDFRLEKQGYRQPVNPLTHAVATDPISTDLAERGPLYPDHVVFLGAPLVVDDPAELGSMLQCLNDTADRRPKWLIVRGLGVAISTDAPNGADAMLQCFTDVAARIDKDVAVNVLDIQDVADLLDWDAERYRQRMATGPFDLNALES